MKGTILLRMLLLAGLLTGLGSCSKKTYLERSNEDAALRDAVRKITRNPSDMEAADAIPVLYKNIKATRLGRIKSYSSSSEGARWDLMIGEYEQLQQLYSVILNSAPAFRIVTPESFADRILATKDSAAATYYALGIEWMAKKGRVNYKKAYDNFKKCESYVPGYKDAENKTKEALNKAMINVLVNPIKDYTGYFNSVSASAAGVNHNETFQQNLVRDLGGRNNTSSPARFFSDKEIRRDSVTTDWIVNLSLKTLDISSPEKSSYSKSLSKQVQIGTDTAGRAVFQTVFATLNIIKPSVTARAEMNTVIKELGSQIDVSSADISEEYRWETEYATFSGDRRALSSTDWDLVNNGAQIMPTKDFMIEQLYKKILPRVRVLVSNATGW